MFTMDSVIEQVRAKKVSTWFGTKIQGAGWRPSYRKKNLGKYFLQIASKQKYQNPGMGIGVRVPAGFLGGSAYSFGANLAAFSAFHM